MTTNELKNYHLLVTPTSFGSFDENLKSSLEARVRKVTYNPEAHPLSAAELSGMIEDVDGFIAGLDEINASVIEAAKQLKVIARYGVGVNNVDLEAAKKNGIVVTNTPGANSSAVAELTVGLMIAIGRNLLPIASATRAGEWPRSRGVSLEKKVIGLIGFGNIGQDVARKLAGFDCKICVYDIAPNAAAGEKYGVSFMDMDEVIAAADILSLHCSLVPETRQLINAETIAKMKDGAYLINTARGELVDDDALLHALDSGKLAGAALDVFAKEPPDPKNPLLKHPHLIATPHTGSHTDCATNNMGWRALENCLAVLSGEEPKDRVV